MSISCDVVSAFANAEATQIYFYHMNLLKIKFLEI
jgi:hypothetical protein